MTSPSSLAVLPPGACDCHTHVFLDALAHPFSPQRRYTPPPASTEALGTWHDAAGLHRVVIVQPSVYAADNAVTLAGMKLLGPDRARGVAVIDEATPEHELDALHGAGIRGVRVNLEIDEERDPARATAWMRRIAERVAPRGWHVQLYASLALLADCARFMETMPVPLVFDHYAGAHASRGVDQPGLREILGLVESGKAYVKLSAPYRCAIRSDYADLEPIARQFIRCNPERMVWGSDWPHPRPGEKPLPTDVCEPFQVDNAHVIAQVAAWAGDADTVRRIFADNPARLYDF